MMASVNPAPSVKYRSASLLHAVWPLACVERLDAKIFDIVAAQGEAKVWPDGVLNDRGREMMAGVRNAYHRSPYPT
jgi:hypothetical protein